MMKNKVNLLVLIMSFLGAFLFACKEKKNIPDVSNVEIPFKYQRFDEEVYSFKNKPFTATDLEKWKDEYPSFLNIYFAAITRITDVRDTNAVTAINKFSKDLDFNKIADTAQLVYSNIQEELDADSFDLFQIINEIEDAFDVKIESEDGISTVQDLVTYVEKLQEN